MTNQFDRDLQELVQAFGRGAVSRRDFVRVGAIASGAVATAAFLAACGGTAGTPTQATDAPTAVAAPPTTAAAATRSVATGQSPAPAVADYLKGAEIQIPWNPAGQGVTLDPQAAPNWGPFWGILPYVYSGLVMFDENARVLPDLAEKWDVTNGGLTYTFHIRKEAKFASGRDVTADDFVYSWKRALDPKTTTPMLNFLEHLQGYKDFADGKTTDLTGVKVIDPKTIALTLSKPYNFFLSYLATFVWYVVDKEAVDKYGKDFVAHPSGTGPWIVTKFDPQSIIEMQPNPNFLKGANPSIAKISWPVLTGPTADNTALNLYKSNDAVTTTIPLTLLDAVKQDAAMSKELILINPSGSIRSLAMNFKAPPFDDVRVRRAFGHAIDRDTFSKVIWRETWVPADYYTPPVVLKSDPGYQPPATETPKFDPAMGKKLLADAGYPDGKGLPEIRYYESASDAADEINRWKAFLDMFKQNLGVTIVHDTSMSQDQIDKLRTQQGGLQLEIQWWGDITETPQLMSEVFRTDSQYMKGVFNWGYDLPAKGGYDPGADAKKFDDLMTQADVEQDRTKANDLYKQGEALALKNAVFVPIANNVPMQLLKPWIKGVRIGWWNFSQPWRFEPDVVVVKH
jgi:oligopeptide transport system substrate-binding protein